MANRNLVISRFVEDILGEQGLELYEKWFAELTKLNPTGEKVTDFEVRDQILEEIVTLVTQGNSLILNKKDKLLIEELLNRFLQKAHLLN